MQAFFACRVLGAHLSMCRCPQTQAVSSLQSELDAVRERAVAELKQRFQREKSELIVKLKVRTELLLTKAPH